MWFLLLTNAAQAQEICNNGRDDDGDGFVDCYDGDCSDDVNCEDFFMNESAGCKAEPEANAFSLKLSWASANQTASSYSRASIGDIDKDGIPEVIVTNHATRRMSILRGDDGTVKQSIDLSFTPNDEVTIADIDGDGYAEIFQPGNGGGDIEAFKYNTATGRYASMWKTTASQSYVAVLGIANFKEQDGKSQLYLYNEILDAATGTRLVKGFGDWAKEVTMMPLAVDMLPDNACANCDGLELVVGGTIYSVNLGNGAQDSGFLTEERSMAEDGTPFYVRRNDWGRNYSSTSVADYNEDGYLDVIASGAAGSTTGRTTVFFWDVQNRVIKSYTDPDNDWKRGTGRLNIANIDNKNGLNVTYVSGSYLYALDENFNQLWRKRITEATSGFTGCTVFDFNDDGAYETVYRDEAKLYIVNGIDGTSYREIICKSRTSTDYPVVADVDGDGATEICVSCNTDDNAVVDPENNNERRYGQIRVYESDGENWVPARKVWNQHGYYNVNINDDLSVPIEVQKHNQLFSGDECGGPHRPLNTFLNQSPYLDLSGCPVYGAADFVVDENSFVINEPTCPEKDFTVSFTVRNEGDITVNGQVPFTAYIGDPLTNSAVKLNTVWLPVSNLRPGETLTITEAIINGPGNSFHLYIAFNDGGVNPPAIVFPNGGILECDYDRNILDALVEPLPFPVEIEVVQPDLKCGEGSSLGQGELQAFAIEGGVRVTTGYEFVWYNEANEEIGRGSIIGSLVGGEYYTVVATNLEADCSSARRTTDDPLATQTAEVTLQVTKLSDVTSCSNPYGSAEANVFLNGAEDDPARYTITWQLLDGTVVGTGATSNQLPSGVTIFVFAQSLATGCSGNTSLGVDELTPEINIDLVDGTLQHVTCDGEGSGSVRVETTGPTNLEVRWFRGTEAESVHEIVELRGNTEATNLASGFYTVLARDIDTDCESDYLTFEIKNEVALPQLSRTIIANTACDNSDANLANGSITVSATTNHPELGEPAGGYTYEWYLGNSTEEADKLSGETGPTLSGRPAGRYIVRVTNNDLQCETIRHYTIRHQPASIDVLVSDIVKQKNTVCNPGLAAGGQYNGAIQIQAIRNSSGDDVSTGDYTYVWYNEAGEVLTPANASGNTAYNLNGGQTYRVEVTNNTTGCFTSENIRLNNDLVNPQFTLNVRPQTSCDWENRPNGRIQLMQNGSPLDLGSHTTEWFAGATDQGASLYTDINELDNQQRGTFTVRVTTNETGCSQTQTVTINESIVEPVVSLSSTNIDCSSGNDGSLTAAVNIGVPTDYTYTWRFTATGEVVAEGEGLNQLTTWSDGSPLPTGEYSVVVVSNSSQNTNPTYCQALTKSSILRRNQAFTIETQEIDKATACGASSNGRLRAEVPGGGTYTYTWYRGVPANLQADFYTNPPVAIPGNDLVEVLREDNVTESILETNEPGVYTVVAENAQGCKEYTYETLGAIDAPDILEVITINSTTCAGNGQAEIRLGFASGFDYHSYEYYLFNNNVNPEESDIATAYASITNATAGTAPVFQDLPEGTYSVLVLIANSAGNACISTRVFNIEQEAFSPEIAQIVLTNNSNCAGGTTDDNGSIQVQVTPKDAVATSYTYTLKKDGVEESIVPNQSTSYTFSGLGQGNYSVEVMAEPTGCTVASTDDLEINYVPIRAQVTTTNAVSTHCDIPHNGSIKVNSVSGASNTLTDYEFAFYTKEVYDQNPASPSPALQNSPSQNLAGLEPGEYVVIATLVSASSTGYLCTSEPTFVTVGVDEEPLAIEISATNNNTSCTGIDSNNDGSLTVSIREFTNAPANGFQYQWHNITTGQPELDETTATTTHTLSGLGAGTYRVVVTNLDTQCSIEAEATLYNIPNPPVMEDGFLSTLDQTLCDPSGEVRVNKLEWNETEITNFSDYTFSWYFGDDLNHALVDYAGNPITGSVLTVADYPVVAGTYHVVATRLSSATGGAGCSSAIASAEVEYNPPTIAITLEGNGDQTSCLPGEENGRLLVSALSNPENAADAYTFIWYVGSGTSGAEVAYTAEASGLNEGTHTVLVTNTRTGCSATAEYYVAYDPYTPNINAVTNDLSVCPDGGSIEANGSVLPRLDYDSERPMKFELFAAADEQAANNMTYPGSASAIRTSVFNSGDAKFPAMENLESGYYVLFTAEDFAVGQPSLGCDPAKLVVYIDDVSRNPQPVVDVLAPARYCANFEYNGQPANTGQLSANVNGRISGYTFVWYQATQEELQNSTNPEADFTYSIGTTASRLLATTYTLRVTDNLTGCYTDIEQEVPTDYPVIDAPFVRPLPQTICLDWTNQQDLGLYHGIRESEIAPDGVLIASVNEETEGYTFEWQNVTTGETLSTTGATASGLAEGNYRVRAIDVVSGCPSGWTDVVVGGTYAAPSFRLEVEPASCRNESGSESLGMVTLQSVNTNYVVWYDEAGNVLPETSRTLEAPAGTGYRVRAYGSNFCYTEQSFTIGTEVSPYNLVTPNQDGLNDHFIIDCIEDYPTNTVKVFNRAGTVVFEMENYNATDRVFTGRGNRGIYLNGNKLPDGTYFYIIDKHLPGQKPLSGYLELKR
jgi:gliding motility-associated-like protein